MGLRQEVQELRRGKTKSWDPREEASISGKASWRRRYLRAPWKGAGFQLEQKNGFGLIALWVPGSHGRPLSRRGNRPLGTGIWQPCGEVLEGK